MLFSAIKPLYVFYYNIVLLPKQMPQIVENPGNPVRGKNNMVDHNNSQGTPVVITQFRPFTHANKSYQNSNQ